MHSTIYGRYLEDNQLLLPLVTLLTDSTVKSKALRSTVMGVFIDIRYAITPLYIARV
jgi:hypothetical protein